MTFTRVLVFVRTINYSLLLLFLSSSSSIDALLILSLTTPSASSPPPVSLSTSTSVGFSSPPGTILPPAGLTACPIDYDGCIILGCPAGTLEYRQRMASASTTKASRPLPAVIIRLPSWSALPLIRQCTSARVGYLARVSELEANLSAFLAFDSTIDAAILSVAGVTPWEMALSFWLPTI